jgi:hypothetical protein
MTHSTPYPAVLLTVLFLTTVRAMPLNVGGLGCVSTAGRVVVVCHSSGVVWSGVWSGLAPRHSTPLHRRVWCDALWQRKWCCTHARL